MRPECRAQVPLHVPKYHRGPGGRKYLVLRHTNASIYRSRYKPRHDRNRALKKQKKTEWMKMGGHG